MRAHFVRESLTHFVRGVDPKDSMDIGNKHAREIQKLKAAFKDIDPDLDPKMTDDQTKDESEMAVVSVFLGKETYSLAWVKSGLEYYLAAITPTDFIKGDRNQKVIQNTFPKLEQAREFMRKYLG